tara:strand:+ start:187 stop:345 length:159 start_codon:yes stop_codon:yes gene_type:complete
MTDAEIRQRLKSQNYKFCEVHEVCFEMRVGDIIWHIHIDARDKFWKRKEYMQ